jgi:hypothetical protein
MKIKNLKFFKNYFEKKEQLKLQKKDEFIKKIKKDWTKEELVEMQVKNMYSKYYSNDIGYKYTNNYYDYHMTSPIQNFDEFELKYYMLYTNANMFTKEEFVELLNSIETQKTKKNIM